MMNNPSHLKIDKSKKKERDSIRLGRTLMIDLFIDFDIHYNQSSIESIYQILIFRFTYTQGYTRLSLNEKANRQN